MTLSLSFVQLPLITKPTLTTEEQDYFDAYWRRMGITFQHTFNQSEVYTIPEFPLWITQLANAAKDAGWEPRFIDLAVHTGPKDSIPREEILRALAANTSTGYAFSPFTSNYSLAVEFAAMIRRTVAPGARILVGGAHATALPERCAKDGFDYVIRGNGDNALNGLLRHLAGEEQLKNVPSITHIDRGMLRHFPESQRASSQRYFDRLPSYDIIPRDYKVHFGRVYCSLGCPYGCSFCADTIWIKMKPVFKSIPTIIGEIEMIRRRFGVNLFLFGDEVFTLRADFVFRLCEALQDLDVSWFCQTRANLIQPRVVKAMRAAGCKLIQIGAESADEAVLDQLEKKVSFETVKNACAASRDAGLDVLTYWMVGGPSETRNSAERTLDCIDELFAQDLTQLADYYICTPYPGTDLYREHERYGVEILYSKPFDDWREDQPSVMRTRELDEYKIFELWKWGLARITRNMRRGLRTEGHA